MTGNWTDIVFIALPLAYFASAATAPLLAPAAGWRTVQTGGAAALLLALLLPWLDSPASGFFAASPMNLTMTVLVSFIGLIVARFSAHYLEGDEGQARFQRWLQVTLGCVAIVVTSNHFGALIAAWIGISLSLHQLLMYYPNRKRAVLAAHKKFIFARIAELSLIAAAVLLYQTHGSLLLSDILAAYATPAELSLREQLAALLIASAAMVKCAQFPMHGWLIQVVEAPTPVSALLHAGVINLGGFLLLAFAPLMLQADLANWLLLIVAGLTCVAAALITMTRVSIKVLLAWSTVAQMGLMLVECALGQYGLALLHLVAHSCYKAYAFLSSGGEVENYLRKQMALPAAPGAATLPVLFAVAAATLLTLVYTGYLHSDASLWLLLALFPVIMLSERSSQRTQASLILTAGLGGLFVIAYAVQKAIFGGLAPVTALPGFAAALWCAALATLLIGAYWVLRQRGHSDLGRRLYRNLYAGFYLDEWATRVTLAVWPARLPQRAAARKNTVFLDQENLS
ncbi:MAG: NADH-quinone oxidoreductase subunit L [Halieaceae bacterium]|jgi:NAD(P)H-quinone oxidoreductase subunit 5|nr:NADH-quinone oxidoreductase subunit L [Halieaceae bacterium]